MTGRTRYAVVGLGSRARMFTTALTTAYRDGAELVALCDPNRTRMAWHNEKLGVSVPCYRPDDFTRMLAEQRVDRVIVTSVDRTHHRYAIGAMEHGCEVITEKPLTIDAARGFFTFLMTQFIRGLPTELDDAARIDGCAPVQTYRRVILPLMTPALVTTAIFTFIWTWDDFFSQLVYLDDTDHYTVPMVLRAFLDSTGDSTWGAMFAMATLALIPVLTFFLIFQRHITDGISTTGLRR